MTHSPCFLGSIASLLLLTTAHLFAEAPAKKQITIAIQPFAGFNVELTQLVAKNLSKEFGAAVKILPDKPLPKAAFYQPRSRYRADLLLDHLAGQIDPQHTKILGLTRKDISTTKGDVYDWGIFGLGSLGGEPCVVSSFRLRARGADEKLFRQRLVRVATHEIGHTLGLPHCPDPQCNMVDAKGSILSVDQGTGTLCKKCQKEVLKN